jgi:hypothetical protein
MFCQIATGSLLLSANGALQLRLFWVIAHCCAGAVNIAVRRFAGYAISEPSAARKTMP